MRKQRDVSKSFLFHLLVQALIECISKITKKIRYKGLDFTKTKEYSFNDIPALEQAGWTKEEYEKQK